MAKTDITVVIALDDRANALPVMLSCLEQQRLPASRYDVVIVPFGASQSVASMTEQYAAGAPMPVRCCLGDAPTEVAAKNLGAKDAEGVWILFLDQDLVAGPSLLEAHVKKQTAKGGRAVLMGGVAPHSNLPRGAFTRWFMKHDRMLMRAEQPDSPLHWSSRHCSVPRRLFLEQGGFDEQFKSARAADVELAYRMKTWDCPKTRLARAEAYIWHAAQITAEQKRFLREGYELYLLAQQIGAPEIIDHFRLSCSRMQYWLEGQFTPYYMRALQKLTLDVRLHHQSCRRVLRHELRCGALAARTGAPYESVLC